MMKINLRSRRGEDGPLGFLIALPVWWATMGVVFVLGFWLWSLAANTMSMTRSGQAIAVGKNGAGTPTMFINGRPLPGAVSFDFVRGVIEEELSAVSNQPSATSERR